MKASVKKGFSFGLTSGVITTLGMIVGLNASTHSVLVVIGGILMVAIADSLSDSLGIHISEESNKKHTKRGVWESTFSSFISKLIITLTFIIPVLLFKLETAVIVSIIWGLFLISVLSYDIAKKTGFGPYKSILEHLGIAVVVIILTHFVGKWISIVFS